MGLKVFKVLRDGAKRKDMAAQARLERNKVRATIELICEERLKNSDDVLTFEALPTAISDVITVLELPDMLEKYEFAQVSETLFQIKLRELDILI